MLVIVPFIGAVVTEDNLATGGKVEVTVVAGDTTGEVHASLWVLLLPPPLILLKSSKSGKSKAGKEASSSCALNATLKCSEQGAKKPVI